MVENLKRVREPVAWTLLAVIVGSMVLSIVSLVREMSGSLAREAVFAAFASIASNAMNLTLVVSLVAMVCLCLFVAPATAHAEGVARAALTVVALGTLLTLVATGLGVAASAGVVGIVLELLGGLLDIALKVAAVAVLWVINRGVRAGRLTAPVAEEAEPIPTRAIVEDAAPVWQPDAAAGSVWTTAAQAAAGSHPVVPPPATPAIPSQPVPGAVPGAAAAFGWRPVDKVSPARGTDGTVPSRDTP